MKKARRVAFFILALSIMFNVETVIYASEPDKVDRFISRIMNERAIPGLQLGVVKNGKIVKIESYGISNIQDMVKVSNNTVFTINSITKAFVGVAILQLVESKEVALSDPIGSYLSELPQHWKAVTIQQLLSHTSGLPEIMVGNEGQLISGLNESYAFKAVQELPMASNPGIEFKYTQTNYLLLGKLIEKVLAETFQEFIIKNQLKVVGMPRTIEAGFSHMEKVIPEQARNYTYYKVGSLSTLHEHYPPSLRTVAGMSSNVAELSKWIIALQNGSLISSESLGKLWTPVKLSNDRLAGFNSYINGYSLGWPVVARGNNPAILSVGGNRAIIAIYPQKNISIILLTNLMGVFQ